jgi:hypothetical protein
MLDRILILISLALLAAFCGVLVTFIGRLDLTIVIVICVLMAAYDLLIYNFRRK